MTMVSLTAVEPLEPGFVTLTWDDGVTREVDISDLMTGHAVLEMLQIPEIFRAVAGGRRRRDRMGEWRRFLCPGPAPTF